MKKIILFTLVLTQMSIVVVVAQSLVVTGDTSFTGNLVTQIAHHLDLKNTSASPITVKCQKTNLSFPDTTGTGLSGAESYYCFAGNCYGANDTSPSNSAIIAAGQQISFNNFPTDVDAHSGYYDAYGVSGIAEVQYCFYDVNDSLDQTCVIITYSCFGTSFDCIVNNISDITSSACVDPGTGLGQYASSGACNTACSTTSINDKNTNISEISDFYPNPASGMVSFTFNGNLATLTFIDILGNKVKEISLDQDGIQKLDLSDLNKGIYFGNLIVNDQVVSIKKVIVK